MLTFPQAHTLDSVFKWTDFLEEQDRRTDCGMWTTPQDYEWIAHAGAEEYLHPSEIWNPEW